MDVVRFYDCVIDTESNSLKKAIFHYFLTGLYAVLPFLLLFQNSIISSDKIEITSCSHHHLLENVETKRMFFCSL